MTSVIDKIASGAIRTTTLAQRRAVAAEVATLRGRIIELEAANAVQAGSHLQLPHTSWAEIVRADPDFAATLFPRPTSGTWVVFDPGDTGRLAVWFTKRSFEQQWDQNDNDCIDDADELAAYAEFREQE